MHDRFRKDKPFFIRCNTSSFYESRSQVKQTQENKRDNKQPIEKQHADNILFFCYCLIYSFFFPFYFFLFLSFSTSVACVLFCWLSAYCFPIGCLLFLLFSCVCSVWLLVSQEEDALHLMKKGLFFQNRSCIFHLLMVC